jgi:hypothetical protein
MQSKVLLKNPWVFGALVLAMGAAIGSVCGYLAFAICKFELGLTQNQLDPIFPGF